MVLVDCGSICAGLEHAAGRKPDKTLGKPDPGMLTGILKKYHLGSHQVAVAGDRVYTDIAMAHDAGVMGVLVLSGETTQASAPRSRPKPHIIARSLEEFGQILKEAY